MFKLDQQFLEDVGLNELPDDQKQAFLEHIYSQLEVQVGTRLSDGLSDEQLSEFESFIDRDDEKVRTWIEANVPSYRDDVTYQQLRTNAPVGTDDTVVLAEYASLKWLEKNRPDYREVVRQVLESLKQEIIANRDTILGS